MLSDFKKKFVLEETSHTVNDALVAITENRRGAVIVLADNGVISGIVSDGDIRRALVRGAVTLAPLSKIVNSNPISAHTTEEGEEILQKHLEVNVVPIVDAKNKLVDIVVRNEEELR